MAANSHVGAGGITVNDSAANVQGGLATLETSIAKIGTITLTNSTTPTLTVTYAQFAADASVLSDISSPYSLHVTSVSVTNFAAVAANSHVGASAISVSDTAADVQNGLSTLYASYSQINTITLTDGSTPTITVTYAQFSTDSSVLSDISSPYNLDVSGVTVSEFASVVANSHVGAGAISVSDSAINVQNGLATLEANVSKIGTIALTDGSTPTITVAYSQFAADGAVLADISSAYKLDVTGVTVANFASVAANSHVGAGDIQVADLSANIQAGLATLEASASQIGAITADGQSHLTRLSFGHSRGYAADNHGLLWELSHL